MVKLILGDCMDILPTLEPVHCVVTSPPYWGLRDYGLPPLAWGGDKDCWHEWGEWSEKHDRREETKHGKTRTTDRHYGEKSRRFNGNHQKHTAGQFCQLCGAWRGCLGLEPTPELYVEHLVMVFREVRNILRDDGTLWLNLGDSYAGAGDRPAGKGNERGQQKKHKTPDVEIGLKPKDLVGIPWRVAFALQADGWWLRSDIIWHKPNCMPESVRDRPTKAHEYIFLLSKSARYYYDHEAIREGNKVYHRPAGGYNNDRGIGGGAGGQAARLALGFKNRDVTTVGRNKRTVWTIPTRPFKGAHFAVFPPALIEPCILAGCPLGGTVLDPFGGSGTVGAVATGNNRNAILIDLKDDYLKLAKERIAAVQPKLTI